MALLNTSLPNLIGGVSQQPDSVRFEGQCEEQTNAISSVVDGLSKRPNTKHIAKLLASVAADSFVHFIDRSASERYVIIVDGISLRAFNLQTGAQCNINNSDSYSTSGSYLNEPNSSTFTFNPRNHIKALTVADNTFLLNTQKNILQNTTNKTDPVTDNAVVTINQGDYAKQYRLDAVRKISPATVGVAVEPFGIQYKHTFSITNFRYAYHVDGTNTGTKDYEQVFRIYPKGFTPNHPSALRAEISVTASDYSSLSSAQKTFIQGTTTSNSRQIVPDSGTGNYSGKVINITKLTKTGGVYDLLDGASQPNTEGFVLLDEEFPEWVVEAPRDSTPMGTFNITSGGDNASHKASTETIARHLIRPAGDSNYNRDFSNNPNEEYVDFSVVEARAAFNANFTLKQHGSSIVVSDFPKQGETFNSYFGTAGNITTYTPTMGDGDTVEFNVSDGLAGTGISVAHNQTDSITSLPAKCLNNFKIKIVGDTTANEDDYYVKFITNSGSTFGDGAFVETSGSNINQQIDSTTFLHRLINTAPNEFSLKSVDPTARTAGDDISNPFPSFVYDGVNGNANDFRIQNLFFFKNRLGLLSNENVIMSESGEPFNFFRTTTLSLLDTAPIDISIASTRVTNLKSAQGFQENLIIFAENGQFVLKGGDILSPRTVSVTPVTNFDSDSSVDPITLGAYVYFPFARSGFTGVREYTVNSSTDVYDSTEITEHIPRYIPSDIFAFAGTSSDDALSLVSSNDKSSAYIYRYFFNGQKKLLSSWFKFTFDGEIRGLSFIESELYIILAKNNETHITSMSFDAGLVDTGVNHNTYLDMRRQVTVAAGASTIDLSSFYTPADNTVNVYTTDGALIASTNSGATVTLTKGALSSSDATNVFVGIPYTMTYTFSKQMFKQASGQSKSPSAGGTMKLKSCSIFYNNTAHFQVKVTPVSRDTYVNNFSTDVIDVTNIGLNLDDGFFRVPVFSNAEDTTITIENSSALPSNFQSAEFEVNAHQRSRRF